MVASTNSKHLPALGILGGTFDPIHNGHLIIAQALLEQLKLARLLFLISARPPHKKTATMAPWEDRLQMVRLALQGDPRFGISDLEIQREGPSYTVETMEKLQNQYGHRYRVLFVIGADSILEIFNWREPQRLLETSSLVVVPRPGFDLAQLDPRVAEKVTLIHAPLIEISSTEIRRRVRQGRSIRYLLPQRVADYIHANGLYRRP